MQREYKGIQTNPTTYYYSLNKAYTYSCPADNSSYKINTTNCLCTSSAVNRTEYDKKMNHTFNTQGRK